MLIPILTWFFLSMLVGLLGRKRAFGFWGFFLASVVFTPLVVLGVLMLTAPVENEESYS